MFAFLGKKSLPVGEKGGFIPQEYVPKTKSFSGQMGKSAVK